MKKLFYAFLAALNLFCFYVNQDNAILLRGFNLACCLLMCLCTIIEATK